MNKKTIIENEIKELTRQHLETMSHAYQRGVNKIVDDLLRRIEALEQENHILRIKYPTKVKTMDSELKMTAQEIIDSIQ